MQPCTVVFAYKLDVGLCQVIPPNSLYPFTHRYLPTFTLEMCHWRRVRNNYKRCGHYIDLPDQLIECVDRHCRFSATHPINCVPPRCTETCWQYRQFPQQFNPVIDDYCVACIAVGTGKATSNASKYA